jgi:neuronal PAS domain-containing protein 1/3
MGKLRRMHNEEAPTRNPSSVMGFIGLAIALPPPSVHEVRLESDMFVTRLTFDFKIAHCEPK